MSGEFTAFFYGTLMAPEVFFSVCYGDKNPPDVIKGLHTFTPAILDKYCRHRVKHAEYPGIIPEDGHCVRGIYATGLTDANLSKLDYFEGSEYRRDKVSVTLLQNVHGKEEEGDVKETSAYVFLYPEQLEKIEWDFEHFRKEKMGMWTRGDWAFTQDPDDKAILGSAV
jgi:gamma-glutamylcyclotransferase (GGCT)/AIG2-like uncharacterized protein YtfP